MSKKKRYDDLFMDIAIRSSEMSHCERAQVGSVIVHDNRVVVNAWNGTVSGADNCCEEEILRCTECDKKFPVDNFNGKYICPDCGNWVKQGTQTKNNVVHAEANAILFAAKNGIKTEGCTMYVTLAPCIECAKMIKQAGIVRVIYDSDYRKSGGLDFLKRNNILIQQIDNIE